MSTIVKPIPHTVDLNEPVKKTYIDTLLATEDNLAHRFDITIKKGGEAVALPDGTAVTACFIRYSDNATVPITNGTISGNVASITLTSACYNKPGQFALIIKVSGDGGIKNTVFYGEGTVFASSTDKIVDEENVVPSLADLLAQIEAMETATEAAKTATTNAKSATTKANNATTSANNAATAANTAADAANAAAQNWSNGTAANAIQLNGKDASEYLLAADALNMDLLWENATPESNLSSGAQVWFDNGYEFVVIIFSLEVGSKNRTTALARLQADTQIHINAFAGIAVEGVPTMFNRLVFLSSNGMVFGGGNVKGLSATGYPTSDDSKMIPLLIYGIKGVDA